MNDLQRVSFDGHPIKYFQKKVFEINKKILTWKQCCSMKGKTKIRVLIRNKFFRLLTYK
jgi:hypothetical protein